jgi:hypothetical protein
MTGFKSKKAAALDEEGFYTVHPKDEDDDIQVYQRPWVGLTIEEIAACCMESTTTQLEFAQAIEAKLKEKNT